jgi:hypothetical protein
MSQAAQIIDLEEFRKRRETKAMPACPPAPMTFWTPVWVWVMVWPA